MYQPALLALEDGTCFTGLSIGRAGETIGEVVFNTAMTGYQEILSDPSYCRQIITFTCPHIGNVGYNDEDLEQPRVLASGMVIRDLPLAYSNWRGQGTLAEFLETQGVIAIAGIDTRQLTRILRDKGAQRGCIQAGNGIDAEAAVAKARSFAGLQGMDLAREVTTQQTYAWSDGTWEAAHPSGMIGALKPSVPGNYKVVVYDFGVKHNILRMLVDRGCELTVVPAQTSAEDVLALAPDGVMLSNGPGDPEPCDYAIEAIRTLVDSGIPTFGICLGHQLLALASGARTEKMKFGHHGANHPVQELGTGRVMITSQNHGFAVSEQGLPDTLEVTHRSLFDGTLQGIRRTDRPAFGFQGHPEASPGPHDASGLFDQFVALMADSKSLLKQSAQ
ncbi:MAG: glutamine-hydrolyzing carbamoyl-phosphate synthase small subunit [Gammaproteobacteria bacterium]|nr:glutamine-hydrolyzing carbamoyl-phosphate synthase small subunit [Gammaproteobacteria bacterium]